MRKIANNDLLKQVFKKYFDQFGEYGYRDAKVSLAALITDQGRSVRYNNISEAKIDEYILKIVHEYDRIILADQTTIATLVKEFGNIIAVADINEAFWNDIVTAMDYKNLRKKEFIQLVQELGIKTCVYCHSQLTVVIDTEFYVNNVAGGNSGSVKKRRGLLELDHRHPKSKYPFLCTSFYNLYPSCGNCNLIKSQKDSTFDLYTELDDLAVFHFSVDKNSVTECLNENDSSKLKIEIAWSNITDADAKAYLELFDIKEIYDTQKDIVEELIHKKVVYTDKYKQELHDEFLGLFENPAMINRLIIGNYDQPEEIFRRPMAKFIQDIARDIDLIPKLPPKTIT